MSAEEKCLEILKIRDQVAPIFRPKVIPRGFDDNGLQSLCKTKEQRRELEACIEEYSSKITKCSVSGVSLADGPSFFCTEWAFNPEDKTITLSRLLVRF